MSQRRRGTLPSAVVTAVVAAAAAMVLSLLAAPIAAAAPQPVPGSLSGVVRDQQGTPVAGTVRLFPPETTTDSWGPPVAEAPVAPDGTWRIPVSQEAGDLREGRYLIRIKPTAGHLPRWYRATGDAAERPEDATPVTAAPGADVTGLDVVVPAVEPPDPTPRGQLSGTVTDARGAPVAAATVDLFPAGAADTGPPAATVSTAADGSWRLPAAQVPAGDYLVRASGDPALHLARWFRDAPTPAGATALAVDPSTIRTDLDVVLPDAPTTGEIRGQVVANRRAVPGATVTAFGPAGPVHSTQTDERGGYEFAELPAGEYRVRATATQYSLPGRWHPASPGRLGAQQVTLAAGDTLPGVDIDMSYQPIHPGGPDVKARGPRTPKRVLAAPLDVFTPYQGQRRCIGRAQPGAVSLYYLLKRTYGNITIGLNRRCLRDTSEHYDGRALDWMVSIRNKAQARKGDAFTQWLTRTRGLQVGAMARRLGVMYVIWRDRIWKQYQADKGWQKYYDCGTPKKQRWVYDRPCHRDHVHISMNWPGARKQTSWWAAG